MLTPIFSDVELSDGDATVVTGTVKFAPVPDQEAGYGWSRRRNSLPCEDDPAVEDDDDDEVREIVVRLRGLQERRTAAVGKWLCTAQVDGGGQCRQRCVCCCRTCDVQPDDQIQQFDSLDVVGTELLASISPVNSLRSGHRHHQHCDAGAGLTLPDDTGLVMSGAAECSSNLGPRGTEDGMNGALHRLRQELASLLSQDGVIFEQLLALRRSISHLKHQSSLLEDWADDDAEVTYLSSNAATGSMRRGRLQRGNSIRMCRRRDSGAPLVSTDVRGCRGDDPDCCCCPTSGEDSAFSLESSGVSSPSLSPSPTSASLTAAATNTTATPSSAQKLQHTPQNDDPTSFIRNNVTFPPSRNRQSRFNSLGFGLSEKGLTCSSSTPYGVDTLGRHLVDDVGSSVNRRRPTTTALPHYQSPLSTSFSLVRSRSITFLPRGALVRREESCDSGFDGAPCRGEVFV